MPRGVLNCFVPSYRIRHRIKSAKAGLDTGWRASYLIDTLSCRPITGRTMYMARADFEDIVEDFEFLEDWEDRYRYIIDLGKATKPLEPALKVPATKVNGCASQVWLHPVIADGVFRFDGESDAMIVQGLIAVLQRLYNGMPVGEVAAVDARAEFGRLGMNDHLSAQRSNGLRAMIERIRQVAAKA